MPGWLITTEGGCHLALYVQPGAKRSGFAGEHDGRLKIRVAARAVDGAANRAVMELLAAAFGVALNRLSLLQGDKNRRKLVRVMGIEAAKVQSLVEAALEAEK